jgi:hypothetical protein
MPFFKTFEMEIIMQITLLPVGNFELVQIQQCKSLKSVSSVFHLKSQIKNPRMFP